jgi:hypothetical protein
MRIQRHAVMATMLGLLAVTAFATPASAAVGATRWVDDDGRAGPDGCGGTKVAHETIQDGVDAASTGDTVKVCPGSYPGFVTIATNGITVTGVKPWKARVIPGAVTARVKPAGGGGLISVLGDDVRVQWLKVQTPNTAACINTTGIGTVGADRVQLRSNLVQGRTDDRSLVCGITTAIDVQDSTGWVSWNIVRQYWFAGINVDESSLMRVNRNSIQWAHTGDLCASTACRTRPSRTAGVTPAGGPSQPAIQVGQSTGVRVARNIITVTDEATTPPEGGIAIYGSDARVIGNTVDGARYGIVAAYGSRGELDGNRLLDGSNDGIFVYSNDVFSAQATTVLVIEHNYIRRFGQRGIALDNAAGNLVQDNDVRAQGDDCFDSAIPTESTWIGEQGLDQNQPGLCKPVS